MTEDQIRAEEAQRILSSHVFKQALEMMQDQIDRERAATAWNETKKREHLFLKEKMLVDFVTQLNNVVASGEIREPAKTIRERIIEQWGGKFPLRINR